MSYVVLPEFHVLRANLDEFLTMARQDASASLADEEGCRQFDIAVEPDTDPVRVLFYEVYDDRAAFEAHLLTPHLAAFREALRLCDEQPVRFLQRAEP